MRSPKTDMDCIGKLRDMKDEWRRSMRTGGYHGGLGRRCHVDEIGSKEKNSIEFKWWLSGDVGETTA